MLHQFFLALALGIACGCGGVSRAGAASAGGIDVLAANVIAVAPAAGEQDEEDILEDSGQDDAQDQAGETPDGVAPKLEIVAELNQRPGNIAVTAKGQVFFTMHPFDAPEHKVMQLTAEGMAVPFPNAVWSSAPDENGAGISDAIGIAATPQDALWVLDLGTEDHQPKLVGWDLNTNRLSDVYYLPSHVNTPQSFHQDFAYDWSNNAIFVADMGQADSSLPARPAILAVDLNTGHVRRLLDSHESLMPPEAPFRAGGEILKAPDGSPRRMALNPITIMPLRGWVYYAPMGPGKIYRVRSLDLLNAALSPEALAGRVEVYGEKPSSDGMTIDTAGNIYIADVDRGAIGVTRPDGSYDVYIEDELLSWPDGFSFGPDGYIYVTVNQLHKSAALNGGAETGAPPYLIARFKPLAPGSIGR